jgi:hypothetical protein
MEQMIKYYYGDHAKQLYNNTQSRVVVVGIKATIA